MQPQQIQWPGHSATHARGEKSLAAAVVRAAFTCTAEATVDVLFVGLDVFGVTTSPRRRIKFTPGRHSGAPRRYLGQGCRARLYSLAAVVFASYTRLRESVCVWRGAQFNFMALRAGYGDGDDEVRRRISPAARCVSSHLGADVSVSVLCWEALLGPECLPCQDRVACGLGAGARHPTRASLRVPLEYCTRHLVWTEP